MSALASANGVVGAVVPEDSGGPYVAAAYVVFLVLIAIYVAIMAQRLARISRQAAELEARLAQSAPAASAGAGPVQGGAARDGAAVEPRHAHADPAAASGDVAPPAVTS